MENIGNLQVGGSLSSTAVPKTEVQGNPASGVHTQGVAIGDTGSGRLTNVDGAGDLGLAGLRSSQPSVGGNSTQGLMPSTNLFLRTGRQFLPSSAFASRMPSSSPDILAQMLDVGQMSPPDWYGVRDINIGNLVPVRKMSDDVTLEINASSNPQNL